MSIRDWFSSKSPERVIASVKPIFKKNFLSEKGQVDFNDVNFDINTISIKDPKLKKKLKSIPYDYNLYLSAYKKVPKVFRAINTRANFAIQSDFNLLGEDGDVEKLIKWMGTSHFKATLIQIAKEMLLFGNVFMQSIGQGEDIDLKFLPVTTMYVAREKSGELIGYAQIVDNKVIAKFEPDEIIHFKWNSIGTDAYGIPELRCILRDLEKKLNVENILDDIIQSQYAPKMFIQCGTPEKPFSTSQISNFKSKLESRGAKGDLLVPGDVKPILVNPARGVGQSTATLIDHIEAQVNVGLAMPEILIQGRSDAAASLIQMDAMERADAMPLQDVLGKTVSNDIFKKVLGKDEVPLIVWNPINVETYLRTARYLRQLVGDGKAPPILTLDEAREMLGYTEMSKEDRNEFREPVGQPFGNAPGGAQVPMPKVQKVDKSKPSTQ